MHQENVVLNYTGRKHPSPYCMYPALYTKNHVVKSCKSTYVHCTVTCGELSGQQAHCRALAGSWCGGGRSARPWCQQCPGRRPTSPPPPEPAPFFWKFNFFKIWQKARLCPTKESVCLFANATKQLEPLKRGRRGLNRYSSAIFSSDFKTTNPAGQ